MKFFSLPVLLLAAIPLSLGFLPSVERETQAAQGMRINRVMLFRVFPYEAKPGDIITLEGSGFSKSLNKVYFNGHNAVNATSTNGTSMVVAAPTSLTEGEYRISIANVLGSSENPDIPVSIKITSAPQPAPVIKTASISGNTVTLTGEGFTSSNTILTTLGNSSSPVSASGGTLIFSLTSLSQYEQLKKHLQNNKYPLSLWIYIQNEHGINKNPYKLDITL